MPSPERSPFLSPGDRLALGLLLAGRRSALVEAHSWHDPEVARVALVAAALGATMMARRREGSIRWLMERHGWTSARARRYKAEQEGIPANVALGHAPKGEPGLRELRAERAWGASFYARNSVGEPTVISRDMPYRDAQRAGRYMQLTERLVKGRISPQDFRRRVRRLGEIDGRKPLSDPAAVLAIAAEERALRRRGEPRVRWESGKRAVARARQLIVDRREKL
jgi:hypothetical protein